MRTAAATTVLVGAGLLAGHALAGAVAGISLPTVPSTTVAVPLPPIPTLPSAPKLPPTPTPPPPSVPAVPEPVKTTLQAKPAAPTSVPSVQHAVSSTSGSPTRSGSGSTSGSGSRSGSGSSSGSPATAQPSRAQVQSFHSSRRWISTTGPKRRRVTSLTFVLPHAARVIFVVKQVSPVCRIVGRFAVNGHAGRNRIQFPGPTSRLELGPGTYRISAYTRTGQLVQRVTIVVFDGSPPSSDAVAAARAANACTAASLASVSASTGAANTGSVSSAGTPSEQSAGGPVGAITHSGGVLGSAVERATRAVSPLLVALLALAIVLLGLASLPRLAFVESRANELLARHRLEIAGSGALALVAVAIAFLLG